MDAPAAATRGGTAATARLLRRRRRRWRRQSSGLTVVGAALLLLLLWSTLAPAPGQAQENVGRYTVVAGDTLSAIASRFGIPLDVLVQVNDIRDPALLQVGQELLIPTDTDALALGVVETAPVLALPHESLDQLAARVGEDPQLLAALNGITLTARLWPGQPVAVPAASAPADELRFGAVIDVTYTPQIVQGRTGRLTVTATRPLSLTADWNGLATPLVPLTTPSYTVQALLPAPALIAPAFYTLTVAYTTAQSVPVSRTWPVEIVDGGYAFQNIYVPPEKSDTLDATSIATETELLRATYAPVTSELTLVTPFTRPIGSEYATTSPFGIRRSYNDGALDSYHAGQDFGAPEGVPVTAPAPGTVVLARLLPVRGNAVVVDHGRGIYTGYWHLSELKVTPGQSIAADDVLGLVGNTGRSTGAHLHWELRIDSIAVDPLQFLEEAPFLSGP